MKERHAIFHNRNAECPNCKTINDDCTDITRTQTPSPGDISICFYCLAVVEFTPLSEEYVYKKADMDTMHPDAKKEVLAVAAQLKEMRSTATEQLRLMHNVQSN